MVNNDTVHIDACGEMGGTIYDDGGRDGNYSNSFHGWVVIEASADVTLTLEGSYQLEGCCDYITVWDGNPTTGTQLWNNSGSGTMSLTATSGRMTIRFTTDGSVTYSGFALTWGREGWSTNTCTSGITSFTSTGITSTTATLQWVAEATSLMLDYGQGEQYLSVAGSGIFLSGLNPNTVYYARLYGVGESDNTCCVAQTTFRTGCGPMAAPMVERFDDLAADTMPPCWSMGKNFDDESLSPRVTTAAAQSGSKSLMLSSGNNTTAGHFGMVMSPELTTAIGTLNVHVSLRSNMAGAKVELGVCDAAGSIYNYFGFTPIDTLTITQSGQWYERSVPMGSYDGDGTRLAFRMMQGMQPGSGCIVYIDNLMVENCGVEGLTVSNLGADEMTLSWDVIGTPTTDLTVSGGGTATTYTGVTSPYRITGLASGTMYTLTLRPDCGGTFGESKSLVSVTQTGDTMPLQYCQNFEAGWPGDWRRPEMYGSYPQRDYYSGSYCMRMYPYYSNMNTVVLPRLSVAPSEVKVSMRIRPQVGGSGLVLGVMDYPDEMSSFTPVDTLVNPSSDYRTYTADLSGYDGTGRYLALRSYSPTSDNQYIYIDDIAVGRTLITGLAVRQATASSVTLEWDYGGTQAEMNDSVVIEYGNTGFAQGGGTEVRILPASVCGTDDNKMNYTVAGLDSATAYEFLVYRLGGETVCTPPRVGVTTLQRHYAVPFCESFDGVTGNNYVYLPDWGRTSMFDGRPCLWQYDDAPTASRVLEMHSYGPLQYGRQHSTAVLPHLDYDGSLSDLTVSFYAMFNSDSYTAYVEIGVMTDPADESTFVAVDTVYPPYRRFDHFAVSLAGYSGADGNIALRYYHTCNYCYYTIGIDNLEVDTGAVGSVDHYSVRSDGATVEWTTVGDVGQVDLRLIHGDDTTIIGDVDSPYVVSGLMPGEEYRYELDYGQCYPVGGTFTTRYEAVQGDWCYGFETGYTSSGRYDGLYYPVSMGTGSGDHSEGSHGMYLQSYCNNAGCQKTAAVLPYLEEDDYSGLHFSFKAKGNGCNRTVVAMLADPRDTTGFHALDTIVVTDNTWRQYDYDLTGLEAYGHHLMLMGMCESMWCTSYTDIDELRLARGDVATWSYDATASTAVVRWTTSGSVDSVQLTLAEGDQTVGDTTVAASDGSCTLTGLASGTTYVLTLIAINNTSHRGCAIQTHQLITLDHDVGDGWCETFDDSWPAGWTASHVSAATPSCVDESRYSRRALWMQTGTAVWSSWSQVVLPSASTAVQTLKLSFDAYGTTDGINAMARLVVGVMTDRDDESTFVPLDTLTVTHYCQSYTVDLGAYTGSGRYVAIRAHAVSGYNNYIYLSTMRLSTCTPTDIRMVDVQSTSATVVWQPTGYTGTTLVRYRAEGEGDVDWTDTAVDGTQLTLEGLVQGTTYDIMLAAPCQDTSEACQWAVTTVTLPATPVVVPQCLTVDDLDASTELPWGWVRPYGNIFPRSTTNNYRGGRSLEFRAYRCNSANDDNSSMIVSPYIDGDLDDAWLDFYIRNQNSNAWFVFGTMTDPYDTATFTAHDTLRHYADWRHVTLSLASYSGHYLAIRYDVAACNDAYGYLDELSLATCPMPTVWVSHPQDTTLRVGWSGTDAVWIEYALGPSFTPGSGTRVLATTSPYTIGDLVAASTYTVHVWPECEATTPDEPSYLCNYQSVTQRTMHPPVGIPYCYNFEGVSSGGYPDEWSSQTDGGGSVYVVGDGHYDSRALWLGAGGTSPATALLPIVETSTGCHDSVFLNFWYQWSSADGTLKVGIVTDANDTASFTALDTIMSAADGWHHHTAAIPAPMLAEGRIALRAEGGSLRVDNLCVETCVATDVGVGDLTQHTATISWDGHGVDTLVVEYGISGFAIGTGTVLHLTTSPYTVTGLGSSNDYDFIFRTVCSCTNDDGMIYPYRGGSSGGGTVRYWIDTTTGSDIHGGGTTGGGTLVIGTTTQAELLATPYCDDFDSCNVKTTPAGWRTLRGSTAGYPQVVRTPAYSGARSLDFYTTTGYSNHAALSPVDNPSALVMSFQAYSTNSEMTNHSLGVFTVGVMTDPDQGATFVPVDTITLGSTGLWQQCFVDLSSYSGDGKYIAFRFTPRGASYHVNIDNIYLGSTVVTSATASVGTGGVSIEYATMGAAGGVIVEDTSDLAWSLTASGQPLAGTDASGHYLLTVRAFGEGDTQSVCHLAPIAVNPVMSIPYCETFDGSGQYPDGWTLKHRRGDEYTTVFDGFMQFSTDPSNPDVFLLPPLPDGDSLGGLTVSFDFHANNNTTWNSSYSYIDLGYLTDTANWNTFVTLATGHTDEVTAHITLTLPSTPAGRLAIRARSTYGWHVYDIDNLVVSRIPMPDIANTSSPDLGYASKHIAWDSAILGTYWQYEWGPAGYVQGNGTLATSDSCSLTIGGLRPETDYDIYFVDSTGHYACSPYRFVTGTPRVLPYCEQFDTYGSGSSCRPTGWSWSYTPSDALYCTSSYDYSLMFYSYYYSTDYVHAVMPELYIDSMQRLTMHLRYQYRDYESVAEVGVMETPTAWSTFVPIDTLPCNLNIWSEHIVDFADHTGSGRFVAIRLRGNQYQYNYLYIDRVDIQDAPMPTYTVKGSDSIAAILDSSILSPDYYIEICAPDEAQGEGRTIHVTSHRYTIDSLQPATTYRLYSRTADEGASCFYQSATTPTRLPLPLCEDFDTYGNGSSCRPTGWSWSYTSDDALYCTSSYDYSLMFYSYYYSTGYIYAVMPDLETDDMQNLSIAMRYQYRDYASVAEVGVMTSPTGWDSFVAIDTLPCNLGNWSTRTVHFASYGGDGRFVAIRLKGNQYQYNYLYIDYIRLQTCPLPKLELTGYNTIRCGLDSLHHTADYWIRLTDGSDVDSMIHVESNPYYITGLDTNTAYTLSVQCDSATSSCFPPTVITTGQLHSMPYCEDFDTYGSGSSCYPTGWFSKSDCGNDAIYTTSGNNYSLYFYSYYYNTCPSYAILPDLDIDSVRHLSMQIRFRMENYASAVEIGVIESPLDDATFTPVATFTNLGTNTWYTRNIDFSSYTGDGRYITIRMQGNQYQNNYLYIDNIYLQPIPLVRFTLPAATTITAVVDSTQRADYWLHYTTDGSDDTTHLHVTTNTLRLENLDENSTYHLLATPGAATTASCWLWQSVSTSHLESIPYCETFAGLGSGSSAYPVGWKRHISDGNNDRLYIYSDGGAEDSRDLRFYSNNTITSYAVLPEPDVEDIGSITILTRMWQQSNTDLTQYWLEVGVMDDMDDIATFQVVDTLRCTQAGRWEYVSVSLAGYNGNGRFIALRTVNNSSYWRSIYLDNISIIDCDIHGDIAIRLANSNTVQIDGTASTTGFFVEYGPAGFTQGTGSHEYIDIMPYDLPLDYETSYDFYFSCDSTMSTCLPKKSIITLSPPIGLSHCEDFESYSNDAMPTGWLKYRLPYEYGDDCFVYNDQSHTSSHSLRLCSYYPDRHPYAVMPEVEADSISQVTLSFWMRNAHKDNFSLDVGTVSDPYDMSTFVTLKHFTNTENNLWQRRQVVLADAPSDARHIVFRFNSNIYSWDWLYIDDLYLDTCGASDLQIANIESESVTLDWRQAGTPTVTLDIIPIGDTSQHQTVTVQPPYTIENLTPLTSYMIRFHSACTDDDGWCSTSYTDSVRFFTPAGGTGCIDPTNLTADYVTCFTGSYRNPYGNVGMVDSGAASALSRHTIHFDTAERDPRTGNLLRTVPEGTAASVRLGNWGTHKISDAEGGEAEAITYAIYIDTMAFDLLIMRYAAVMQDPMHATTDQPRFRLELLDSAMNLIDPVCGAADFIANQNLGWNTYGDGILWKDWTTVGLDMGSYAGQTVYVRLTTYDCNEGSHYGYAYFTIDCMRKSMTAEGCGNVASNVFTAPSGFAYRWYSNMSDTTFSSSQSIDVASNNDITYYCNLSFVDNDACNFTMSAFAGTRFPLSLFDSTITISNCQFEVSFGNHSTISMDGINPVGSGEGVETAWWNFGNGQTSNNYHASTVYAAEGTYNVTLITAIAGGACTDTLEKEITLTFPYTNPHIEGPEDRCYDSPSDTLVLREALSWTLWSNDTLTVAPVTDTTYTLSVTDSNGCSQTVSHSIVVHPIYNDTLTASICEGSSLTFVNQSLTTEGNYTEHLTSEYQCDSIVTMTLTVNANTDTTIYDTVTGTQLPYTFNDTTFTDSVTGYAFHTTNVAACDSLITYSLTVIWNDKVTELDSTVCSNQLPVTWNNVTMADTGTYTLVLTGIHGEDSTVLMRLYTVPVYDDTLSHSICDNEQYTFEDTTYFGTDAGPHSHLLHTAVYGCDSLRTLDLDVRATTTGDTLASECDTFFWYGTAYTASTEQPTHLSSNAAGCDSTTTLHLTVRHSSSSTVEDTVIENDLPYTFNGVTFTDSISHTTVTIQNAAQCDSLIDYSLYVHWNVDTTLYDTLCNDALPMVWNGQAFDTTLDEQSGTLMRSAVLTAHTGADSTVWMLLTVHPLFDHHLHTTICDNQSFTFGDSTFSGRWSLDNDQWTVEHLDSLLSVHGCDSLSTLHLTVHPTFDHHLWDTVCSNIGYTWGTPQRQMLPTDSTVATLHGSDSLASVPSLHPSDTAFTDSLTTVNGCDSLSSLHLHLRPAYDLHYYDTICDAHIDSIGSDSLAAWQHHIYRFEATGHDTTGVYSYPRTTVAYSCDSVRTLHLRVFPTYDQHLYDTIYDGDHYIFEQTVYDTTGIYPHRLAAVYACDSLRTLHLQRNRRTYIDTVLCQNTLPYTWNGVTFADDGVYGASGEYHGMGTRNGSVHTLSDSVHLSGLAGIDSLVVMTVTAHDTSAIIDWLHGCDSLRWQDGINYTASTNQPTATYPNAAGCDSVVHLALTVDYTHWAIDRLTACDSIQWIDRNLYYADTTGAVDTIRTVADCDSIVTLALTVHYSTSTELRDTMCHNQTYNWHGFSVHSDSVYLTEDFPLTDTLRTIYNCDSTVHMTVTKMALPRMEILHDIDCRNKIYRLTADAVAPLTAGGVPQPMAYTLWSSAPYDAMLEGHELASSVTVAPTTQTEYMLFADYRSTPFCPATTKVVLTPISVPNAELKVNPEALEYSNLDFTAYDISHNTELERSWYIDWLLQDETGAILEGTAPINADSIVVALRVYNGQCYDTAVRVLPIHRVALFAPNVFTPLADGNNRFIIVGQGIIEGELFIYNREGLLVHHTGDFNEGWDGRRDSDGTLCLQGNYVWKLVYHSTDRPNRVHNEVGTVLLLR